MIEMLPRPILPPLVNLAVAPEATPTLEGQAERLRVLILDQEAEGRNQLRKILETYSIGAIKESSNVIDASNVCAEFGPNLIIMALNLPEEDGFKFLENLNPRPPVIFATATDTFAVRAFDINAIDYLVKPIQPERLAKALHKFLSRKTQRIAQTESSTNQSLVIKAERQRQRVVSVKDLIYVEAEANYSRVFLADGSSEVIRRSMAQWQSILPPTGFGRIHRSLILNLSAVRQVVTESRNRVHVTIHRELKPLTLNRRAAYRLRRLLSA